MSNSSDNIALATDNLTIRFGGHVAVDHVSARFTQGSLTAIVGPNGAGKTTYFNLISGQLKPSEGAITLNGMDITQWSVAKKAKNGLGRAFQLTQLFPNLSVSDNLKLVVQSQMGLGLKLWRVASQQYPVEHKVNDILEKIGLADRAFESAKALSHGAQRRLEVGMMIAMQPKVMMFDEPTAGMSMDEAPILLDLITRIKAEGLHTILLVEHKLDVIKKLADRIIVLHNGKVIADGLPEQVMALDNVRKAYLGELTEEEAA